MVTKDKAEVLGEHLGMGFAEVHRLALHDASPVTRTS
jgi:hypothetical protein